MAGGHASEKESDHMPMATDEIDRLVQAYAAAWSSGEAKAAAAFFTEDAVRVDAAGGVQHGRAEIEAALDELVHRTLSVPKIALTHGIVRMLTPDLALWRGDMDITTADSSPPRKG